MPQSDDDRSLYSAVQGRRTNLRQLAKVKFDRKSGQI